MFWQWLWPVWTVALNLLANPQSLEFRSPGKRLKCSVSLCLLTVVLPMQTGLNALASFLIASNQPNVKVNMA
jgi:hypothetical protein